MSQPDLVVFSRMRSMETRAAAPNSSALTPPPPVTTPGDIIAGVPWCNTPAPRAPPRISSAGAASPPTVPSKLDFVKTLAHAQARGCFSRHRRKHAMAA